MRFLAVVVAIMLVIVLLFSTSPHTEDSHGGEVDMVERIHVMIVMCNRNKDGTNKEEVRM